MKLTEVRNILDKKVKLYNTKAFIEGDPVSVPHQFSLKQDIEIMGLFASIFAWGQRTTIINKSNELGKLFENVPYQFITQHKDTDLKRFLDFKHRTFNATDLLYFIHFLNHFYKDHSSLEDAFTLGFSKNDETIENGIRNFAELFFSLESAPARTRKHISNPSTGSACKRLNMYLRWMVRKDNCGVDFGIWKKIKPSQLICPLDLHVERAARKFGLLKRRTPDWQAALELTANLRKLDSEDPVKYDFALFGMGVLERSSYL